MSNYSPSEQVKHQQNSHYDPQNETFVEPIKQLNIQATSANPGGDRTVWLDSVTGHLFRGATDLEASGAAISYQSLTQSNPFNDGPWLTKPSAPALFYERFGNTVELHFLADKVANCDSPAGPSAITFTLQAPSWATPAVLKKFPIFTIDNNTEDVGIFQISNTGNITIRPNPSSVSVFDAPHATSSGYRACTVTYTV